MKTIINGIRLLLSPRDKWCMLGITVLLSIGAVMEIVGLGLVMPIVATFSKPELFEQNKWLRIFRQLFSEANNDQFLLICCTLVVLLYAVKNLWIFFTIHTYTKFIFSKLSQMSTRIYSGFLHCPYMIFSRHGKVGLHNIILKVEIVCHHVLIPSMTIFVDMLSVIFICAILAITIPWIVLGCTVIFTAGSACIFFPLRKITLRTGEKLNSSGDKLNKVTLYSLEDIKTLKILGAESAFTAQFEKIRNEKSRCNAISYTIGQIPRLALETVAIFSAVAVLMIMLLRGEAVGTVILSFSLLIAAMSRMLPEFSRIIYCISSIRV